jgi:hypothetical protein
MRKTMPDRSFLIVLLSLPVLLASTAAGQAELTDWNYTIASPDRNNPEGYAVITKYVGPGGVASIPAEIEGKPVRVVGQGGSAYLDTSALLTGVNLPDSVTSIGARAFWRATNLSGVHMGSGVQSIGFGAFAYAGSLTNVVLPDSVRSLGGYTFFAATNLTRVVLGSGLTNIGMADFSDCWKLQEVVIPAGVKSVGDFAFNYGTALTNMVLPEGLTNIGRTAFQHCGQLRSVVIPDSVTQIGQEAFAYCVSLTNVAFGRGLTNIGRAAFAFCDSLESATIYSPLSAVPASMFDGSARLAGVVFAASVDSVGDYALGDCPELTSVLFLGAPPLLNGPAQVVFGETVGVVVYHLPQAAGWPGAWAGRTTAPFVPVISEVLKQGNTLSFAWSGTGEIPLSIEQTDSLSSGSWQPAAYGIITGQFNAENLSSGAAFYRAVVP